MCSLLGWSLQEIFTGKKKFHRRERELLGYFYDCEQFRFMGVANYPILDLILKVRSWVSVLPDVWSDTLMSSGGDRAMCCQCRDCLGSPGFGYRCQSCGRVVCRKCGSVARLDRAEQQRVLCKLCFRGDNGPWEAAQQRGSASEEVNRFVSPKSPLSRSSTDRLGQLAESRQFSSPRRPLRCSTYRQFPHFLDRSSILHDSFSWFIFCAVFLSL